MKRDEKDDIGSVKGGREPPQLSVPEMRYQRLFESAKDGILIIDAGTGRILDVNPFLVELLNSSHADFIGKKIWELGFFKDIMASKSRFTDLQEKGYVSYEDLPLASSDGERIDVEFVSNVYLEGTTKVIQCNIRDIRERRRIATEKSNVEQQLRASQKMDALGQLAGGISHEINNLLSVINGYSEMLMVEPEMKPKHLEQLKEILDAGKRAAELTRRLLMFSRKQPVSLKVVNLGAIVLNMEKVLRRLIREDIHLSTRTSSATGAIKANSCDIEQLIMNLAINACDAISGTGKLAIETENVEIHKGNRHAHPQAVEPGIYVMLSVKDTGCGMDGKVLEHIFEPFFSTKEVGKGSGLGLSNVHGIVKQSKAYIDVQSELGKGSMFRIYFPLVAGEDIPSRDLHDKADMPRGNETILLVEDEATLRAMFREQLRTIGYEVLVACKASDALELAKIHEGRIDLLLSDVVMPEMNGFDLAKQLKHAWPQIKVLFMSGYAKPKDVHGMLDADVNFVHKPIPMLELALKIRKILDDGKSSLTSISKTGGCK